MNELTPVQKEILEDFIQNFLPQRGNKRKNSGNELDYVSTSLGKVIKQNFGFDTDRHIILKTFENLGYTIFEREEILADDQKTSRPAVVGNVKSKVVSFGSTPESPYTFIDVSAEIVRHLMKTTCPLPEHTGLVTIIKTENLKAEIENFKKKYSKTNLFK